MMGVGGQMENKYKLIEAIGPGELEKKVEYLAKKGYRLHGSPFARTSYIYQAMIRGFYIEINANVKNSY